MLGFWGGDRETEGIRTILHGVICVMLDSGSGHVGGCTLLGQALYIIQIHQLILM